MSDFNAYVHCRPNGTPFYVGKGRRARVHNFHHRNEHHKNVVAKYGREKVLIGVLSCSSENVAFELERGLIKCLRRSGVRLCNYTDGGEGPTGRKVSDTTRAKQRTAKLGRKLTAEHKAKIGKAQRGKKVSAEAVEKTRRRLLGKKLTAEHRAKLSLAHKGKTLSAEHRAKLSVANKGRKLTDEHKRLIGEAAKKRAATRKKERV